MCILCEKEYENNDNRYYSNCCNKNSCGECLKEWYHKLLHKKCLFCNKDEILYEDFKNEKQHEEMKLNEKSGIKYTKKTKIEFLEYFIKTKIYAGDCKVIICSSYIMIFKDIKILFQKYNVKYIELDDGNIDSIYNSINEYTYGNIKVLLLNSNLFGCGLNLQCTTYILFLHKNEEMFEKQIIGRSQRPGRNKKLNLWYLMHENESIIANKKKSINNYFEREKSIFEFSNLIEENYEELYGFTLL